MWVRWIHARYLQGASIWTSDIDMNHSWLWRKILGSRENIRHIVTIRIGDGRSIKFWDDPWLPGNTLLTDTFGDDMRRNLGKGRHCLVADVLDGTEWNIPDKRTLRSLKDFLSCVPKPSGIGRDEILVDDTPELSLRKAWSIARDKAPETHWSGWLWRIRAPRRYLFHGWKCLRGRLPTLDFVQKRGITFPNRCVLCCGNEESTSHVMFGCDITKKIWEKQNQDAPVKDLDDMLKLKDQDAVTAICILYHV